MLELKTYLCGPLAGLCLLFLPALSTDMTASDVKTTDASLKEIAAHTVKITLPDGLQLSLFPKETPGGAVAVSMALHFGSERSLMRQEVVGRLAGQMLMRGTRKHTQKQIHDEFERLKTRVAITGGPSSASVFIGTNRENLAAALRLTAEILRAPAFPSNEFNQLKLERAEQIQQTHIEPQMVAINAAMRHLHPHSPGDPRYILTPDEEIDALSDASLAEVKRFYFDFYGASNAELAIVGDFDAREMEKLAAELFGDWKSQRPFARIVDRFQLIPAVDKSFETPGKANAFFYAAERMNVGMNDPDYPALVLGNYLLGGDFPRARLAARLQQEEHLGMGVASQFSAGPFDRDGQFGAYAICDPRNMTRLEATFKDEITRVLKNGFRSEEVAEAKSNYLRALENSLAQDASLANKLAFYRYQNRPLAWDAGLAQKINSLTPAQIQAALKRHLHPARMSIFKAGDFMPSSK